MYILWRVKYRHANVKEQWKLVWYSILYRKSCINFNNLSAQSVLIIKQDKWYFLVHTARKKSSNRIWFILKTYWFHFSIRSLLLYFLWFFSDLLFLFEHGKVYGNYRSPRKNLAKFTGKCMWLCPSLVKLRHVFCINPNSAKGLTHSTPMFYFYRSSHRRCSVKKVFLKISQILQENTCVGVSF